MSKMIIAALAASISLAGCAGTGTLPPSPVVAFPTITQIQDAAVAACGFLPAAETVASIVATFQPSAAGGVAIGSQVANAICAAVTANKPKFNGQAPMVNGVVVNGYFVR